MTLFSTRYSKIRKSRCKQEPYKIKTICNFHCTTTTNL